MQPLKLTIAFVLASCVFYLLESISPAINSKPLWRKDSWLDLSYWYSTSLLSKTVTKVAVALTTALAALMVGRHLGPELVAGAPPVSNQPTWLIIFEVLFFGDFLAYWLHRWFHRGWLWRFHAIPHSSKELDWLSSVRLHPVNEIISRALQVIPFVMLGFPLTVLAAYVPFLTAYAILVHANVNWAFGPLRFVIATPRFHRWHHTSEEEGIDKNFAGLFPVWDMIFGTFYMPADRLPREFGLRGQKIPDGFVGQMLYPFKRGRKRKEKFCQEHERLSSNLFRWRAKA